MNKKEWLNEKVFVDMYGRAYNLSDVPMTYMLRKESFKKRKLSKDEINYLWKKELNKKLTIPNEYRI